MEELFASTRREALALAAVGTGGALCSPAVAEAPRVVEPVQTHWLGGTSPPAPTALTWGVPWQRGTLKPTQALAATSTVDGRAVAIQSWPLAYWPDGSMKWTGHAASGSLIGLGLQLAPGKPALPREPVRVEQRADAVVLRTGSLTCLIPRSGRALITSTRRSGRETFRNMRLVVLNQDALTESAGTVTVRRYESSVRSVTVEQAGPVRALVRVDGVHTDGEREWMPFTVRIAVHADGGLIRLVHSVVFDGEAAEDHPCGLGVSVDVPLTDELHNRHLRFAGADGGIWGEAVRNLPGWQPSLFALAGRFKDQLEGRALPPLNQIGPETRAQLATVPSFGDAKLFQGHSRGFTITKRRKPGLAWIKADHGARASGLVYAGGVAGGVSLGLRDFWQRNPTALEVTGAAGDTATVTGWLWSPDGGAMDLRHYNDEAAGLDINYEDYTPGFADPKGIGRTSELFLWAHDATPTRAEHAALASIVREPPLLVASPEHFHATGVFGLWGLPDRSTPVKAQLEDEYDRLHAFYRHEVDARDWYGFWDFGDIMHSYDDDRHCWRYDVGGYAWDNSEMGSDLWLWYAFLRSGDAGRFRMAEAMTRHTSEVDFYHLGRFAKLGTRHGVRHWGDGAKEPRISMAPLRRFLHYLTADERTGDLMRFVVDSDQHLATLSPVRKIMDVTPYPAVARWGPDWLAFAGNWMTEWERTGDVKWRNLILKGMSALAKMPDGLFAGPPLGYDPKTRQLFDIGYHFKVYYLLTVIFGGAEVLFELDTLVDVPNFDAALIRYAENWNLPEPERVKALGPGATNALFGYGEDKLYTTVWHARLTAYAAYKKRDPTLARRAWTELLRGRGGALPAPFLQASTRTVEGSAAVEPRQEIPGITTNSVGQWSLNFIELLALVPDAAPSSL